MKQRYVYVLSAVLIVAGLSVFGYKWRVLGFPLEENQERPVWTIESAIKFEPGPGTIKVNLLIPTLTPGFRVAVAKLSGLCVAPMGHKRSTTAFRLTKMFPRGSPTRRHRFRRHRSLRSRFARPLTCSCQMYGNSQPTPHRLQPVSCTR